MSSNTPPPSVPSSSNTSTNQITTQPSQQQLPQVQFDPKTGHWNQDPNNTSNNNQPGQYNSSTVLPPPSNNQQQQPPQDGMNNNQGGGWNNNQQQPQGGWNNNQQPPDQQGGGWNNQQPPQGGWNNQPQGSWNQQQWNNQQQGGWNNQPQGSWNQQQWNNQGGGWNQPPGQYNNQPPQGGWNQPYVPQPQQGGWNQPPPPGQYNSNVLPPPTGGIPQQPFQQQQQQYYPPSTIQLPYLQHYIAGYQLSKNFNPESEASELYRATRGLLNDYDLITRVIGTKNPTERLQIGQAYKKKYNKEFYDVLPLGLYRQLVLGLTMDPLYYDCHELYHSMKGLGTDENCLIEILVTRSNVQKQSIIPTYLTTYSKSLEAWITSDTSGNLRYFFIKLLSPRDTNQYVDIRSVENDSNKLYYAGENKIGTDEKVFIDILTSKSFQYIIELAKHYEANHKKHSLIKAIQSEFSGNLKKGLCAIVRYAQDPITYFASTLKRIGSFNRTIITNLHQLAAIKKSYQVQFGKSLDQGITHSAVGDHRKLLLEVIKEPKP